MQLHEKYFMYVVIVKIYTSRNYLSITPVLYVQWRFTAMILIFFQVCHIEFRQDCEGVVNRRNPGSHTQGFPLHRHRHLLCVTWQNYLGCWRHLHCLHVRPQVWWKRKTFFDVDLHELGLHHQNMALLMVWFEGHWLHRQHAGRWRTVPPPMRQVLPRAEHGYK